MTSVMYDSVDVDQIPADAPAVLGYVGPAAPNNIYVTFPTLVREFPKARKVSIAVHPSLDAEFLDIESEDAIPADFPGFWQRMHAQGRYKPGPYASRDTIPEVIAAASAAGIPRSEYRLISAHYGVGAHICSSVSCGVAFTADGTQFTDKALGRNLDESLLADTFFPAAPLKRKPRAKPAKPRPKVTAATLTAALAVAITAAAHAAGVKLTPAETGSITTLAALLGGYLMPEQQA